MKKCLGYKVRIVSTNRVRYDNTDSCMQYTGAWTHNLMLDFRHYNRTRACGSPDSTVTVDFTGTFLAITGETEAASISVQIDEGAPEVIAIPKTEFRDRSISLNDLPVDRHTVRITVLSGCYSLDGVEVG